MPSIKDFKDKNINLSPKTEEDSMSKHHHPNTKAQAKRRPGRETESGEELHESHVENEARSHSAEDSHESSAETSFSGPKVEVNFWGSEVLRARFPKSFDALDAVATDWTNDGKFEGLPLGHPMAQFIAAKGLQKAKETEKKVLESPVTEKVATKVFEAAIKAQAGIKTLREKLNLK